MKNHGITLIILLIITIFFTANNNERQPSALASGNSVQTDWSTAERVSGDPTTIATLAEKPKVISSPNGNTVLVTYSGKSSGSNNQDPYYSYSNKNGESGSWVKHKIVAPSTGDLSEHIDAAFDEQGYAHLIWREGAGLAYAKSESTNMALGFNRHFFNDIPVTSKVLNPNVTTFESLVHIIWVESIDGEGTNIYHNISDDHGESWQNYSDKTELSHNGITNLPESPAVQVDDDGNLHVVYQQLNTLFLENRILYTKGDITYNTSKGKYEAAWFAEDEEVEISWMLNFGDRFDIVDPAITYQNGRIDVSATLYFIDQVKYPGNYVYHFYCTSRCDVETNWKTSGAISGSPLKVNITPSNITSSLVSAGGCPIVTYDGIDSANAFNNEQLRNVGKCQNWNNWSYLTPVDIRAIRPSAEMQKNNWWFYVTYEKYINGSNNEVYFMRTKPETTVFLPIILKK